MNSNQHSRRVWLPLNGNTALPDRGISIKKSPVKNTGRSSTQKGATSQDYESLLERDFMTLLEADPEVEAFKSHPFTLRWIDTSGKKNRYTPDFLVQRRSKSGKAKIIVHEVKPRAVIKKDWTILKPKFLAAISWCKEMEYAFKLVTEKEIEGPSVTNFRFLKRYKSNMPTDDVSRYQMHLLLNEMQGIGESTPQSLLQRLSNNSNQQAELIPWLWHLVANGAIGCDLSQPLTMSSRLYCHGKTR